MHRAKRVAATAKPAKPAKPAKKTKAARVRLEVDERRAQLLALGLELFSGQSYDEVSIDELARRAGISKGLLYHYFPTKRDLYVASVHEAARQLLARTKPDPLLSPIDRLRACLDAYLAYVEEHAGPYTALLRGGVGSDPVVASVIEETRSAFLRMVFREAEIADPEPKLRMMLRGWIGLVEAASLDWAERRDLPREKVCDLLANALRVIVEVALGVGAWTPL